MNYCDESDDSSVSEKDENLEECKENVTTIEMILHILSSYNLVTAFPNLYLAYKALGTIPASSSSAERSFSKVNFKYSML